MPSSSPPRRIAILGAGRIGSAFAFQLAREGGHDVTVIARPGSARLAQLQRDQGIIDIKGRRVDVRVLDKLDEQTPYDLLIVTLLSHQTDALLTSLKASSASCIQFMFNTFQPERLLAAIGIERCAFGMPFIQAALDESGQLKLAIGAGGQKTIMSQQRWVDLFNAAGLPTVLEPNMPLWLRCHAPLCIAFESVSVAGERRGGGASWNEALILSQGVHACFTLVRELGYEIYPRAKKRLDSSPTGVLAAILWFMSRIRPFRELLATGQQECCELVDAIVLVAAPLGASDMAAHIKAMKPA